MHERVDIQSLTGERTRAVPKSCLSLSVLMIYRLFSATSSIQRPERLCILTCLIKISLVKYRYISWGHRSGSSSATAWGGGPDSEAQTPPVAIFLQLSIWADIFLGYMVCTYYSLDASMSCNLKLCNTLSWS